MVEALRNGRNTMTTSEYAKNWTEKSPNSRLKTINSILNNSKIQKVNEIKNLKDIIKKREYRKLQKMVGVPYNRCDGKLGGESLDYFKNYLNKICQQHNISLDTQNSLGSLSNEVGEKEKFEQKVYSQYPRLEYLKDQLHFDRYSNMNNISPFLRDLSNLPNTTLKKIKQYDNDICISDRPVTAWKSNNDLSGTPRGRPSRSTRDNVGGVYRANKDTVYVGRSQKNGHYIGRDGTMLHELGHMFDYEGGGWFGQASQTKEFKNFHKKFYNKLESYFQQGGPGGTAGCSEFFAESCYQFFRRGETKFSQYYNKDLCNYMKKFLV